MTAPRDDRVYLAHMRDAFVLVREYVAGRSSGEFRQNRMLQDAIIRQPEIVGEAARHLSPTFTEAHAHVPWRLIRGMRHRLVHEYFRTDLEAVWNAATADAPKLSADIEALLAEHG